MNQLLNTSDLYDYNLAFLNGLSAAHFAQRFLDFERLQNFITTKRLMKVKLNRLAWGRTEDYILIRLAQEYGWGEYSIIMMSPVWRLLHSN